MFQGGNWMGFMIQAILRPIIFRSVPYDRPMRRNIKMLSF